MARRKRYRPNGKRNQSFTLNITSMTDMFTILLVFLLQTYSTDDVQIVMEKGIRLPASNITLNPTQGVKVILTKEYLKINDKVISDLKNDDFQAQDLESHDNEFIKPLFAELQKINAENEPKSAVANSTEKSASKITQVLFQADKELSYNIIRKVFYTASMAGFPQMKMITIVGD